MSREHVPVTTPQTPTGARPSLRTLSAPTPRRRHRGAAGRRSTAAASTPSYGGQRTRCRFPPRSRHGRSPTRSSRSSTSYVFPRLARMDAPCSWWSAAPPGPASPPWSTAWSARRSARPACCGRPPASRSWSCNPADITWFRTGELLPGLTRTAEASDDPGRCSWSPRPALGPGLAFLDAPDIDSVVDENRALAAQLLAAADLWLFVTTAARYADAVPWELLTTAAAAAR